MADEKSEPDFGESGGMEDAGTEIRETDIVFDCPHCGHNLAIDYRGAGLQINCVNCGESVLVPIPGGMHIDDLDMEPGEILKQLFAARRTMQRDELRLAAMETELETMREEVARCSEAMDGISARLQEVLELCYRQQSDGMKIIAALQEMAGAGEAEEAAEA